MTILDRSTPVVHGHHTSTPSPPSFADLFHVRCTTLLPAVAVRFLGALGAVVVLVFDAP